MTELTPQFPEPQHPHLMEYPDAVQDVERARVMAQSSDPHETAAIDARKQAVNAADAMFDPEHSQHSEQMVQRHLAEAQESAAKSDNAAQRASERYDKQQEFYNQIEATKPK